MAMEEKKFDSGAEENRVPAQRGETPCPSIGFCAGYPGTDQGRFSCSGECKLYS